MTHNCVVHVTREYRGFAGKGGIKDVAEGLAKATAHAGIQTHVFMPYYDAVDAAIANHRTPLPLEKTDAFELPMNYAAEQRTEHVSIISANEAPNLTIHMVDSDRYKWHPQSRNTIRRIGIYTYEKSEALALGRPELEAKGYEDYFAMNILLVKATLAYLGRKDIRADIIHCHDGHTATLPLLAQESTEGFAAFLRYTPSLITIHNAGQGYHQEVADIEFVRHICGVPESHKKDAIVGCQLQGSFDPLLAGGLYATAVNTVSENYARELQHTGQDWMTGWLGHTLAERGVTLYGVTNGVDPETWNPETPGLLPLDATFSVRTRELDGKTVCRKMLVQALSRGEIPVDDGHKLLLHGGVEQRADAPLLTFVGRLDKQKGFDVLADALTHLFKEDETVQLLGLGSGDPAIQQQFKILAHSFPGRVCFVVGYSDDLAAKIYAAGDFFVIPSRFEPCGLTDFFAQLMGNLPIVHAVGGLVKTLDGRSGYSYLGGWPELLATLRRALSDYHQPGGTTIRAMQKYAVDNIYENFTWQKVLEKKYLPLYQEAIERMKPALPY